MQSNMSLKRWIQFNARNPLLVITLFLLLVSVSIFTSMHLQLNTNQLDSLNPQLRFVQDIRRVDEMIGGAGQLTVALKGEQTKELKQIAQDLSEFLLSQHADKVREARYKMPIEFVKHNAALFMQTEDLIELKKRVMLKIEDSRKRADPFFFEITPTKPVVLKVDDLIERYSKVGKKSIRDEYYMSADQQMQLIFIKPKWGSNVLDKTGQLVELITQWLLEYKGSKKSLELLPLQVGESLNEMRASQQVIFGFTGTYKSNYDDSFQISNSLLPVSGFALAGVFLVLLIFFGRNLFAIFLIISGLLFGLAFTFAWATVCIGELNMITSILGGILMGLGIDFGIHFLYRLREEIQKGLNTIEPEDDQVTHKTILSMALVHTIRGAGWASVFSGLGSMAAFASLLTSDFKGFSQFGFLAGSGVLLIGMSIYIWVPAVLLAVEKYKPGLALKWMKPNRGLLPSSQTVQTEQSQDIQPQQVVKKPSRALPYPKLILTISTLVCLCLISFAPQVSFEYNTRALMVEGLPSLQLQDEIKQRFDIGSDPVAVYTKTLEQARHLYKHFKQHGVNVGLNAINQVTSHDSSPSSNPKDSQSVTDTKEIHPPHQVPSFQTVDQVLSLYTFVPPMEQQQKNFEILKAWKQELDKIPPKSLPVDLQERWQEGLSYLQAKPFTIDDLPQVYKQNFTHLPHTDPAIHGYLTFIYAGVDLWDGKNMLAFAAEIESIQTDKETYYAAGMPILFSHLTQMILSDARLTVYITTILLLLILLVDFRRIGFTLIALIPLFIGLGSMLGVMYLVHAHLNLMNMVVFPIIIGYGVSHAVYFLHRIREGYSSMQALRSVGKAIACSTLTTLAGWAALLIASHRGLQSMGTLACLGMLSTLLVSLTLMPALLEVIHRHKREKNASQQSFNKSSMGLS